MGRGTTGPSLTSAQETPPGTSQPVDTEGRGLQCPACPTSAPEGFYTEDSPSVTPSAPGCFFLPRISKETKGYCQGLIKAQAQAAQPQETARLLAHAQGPPPALCLSSLSAPFYSTASAQRDDP